MDSQKAIVFFTERGYKFKNDGFLARNALELANSEEEYRESLEVIQRQSQRMNDIINQLLFFVYSRSA